MAKLTERARRDSWRRAIRRAWLGPFVMAAPRAPLRRRSSETKFSVGSTRRGAMRCSSKVRANIGTENTGKIENYCTNGLSRRGLFLLPGGRPRRLVGVGTSAAHFGGRPRRFRPPSESASSTPIAWRSTPCSSLSSAIILFTSIQVDYITLSGAMLHTSQVSAIRRHEYVKSAIKECRHRTVISQKDCVQGRLCLPFGRQDSAAKGGRWSQI